MSARKTTRFAPSFLIGLLAVPLSAVAAFLLITGTDTEAVRVAVETTTAPTTTSAPATTLVVPVVDDGAAVLALACGGDGRGLVEKEADGSITSLEQAALDALRPICEAAGQALAGPPAPAPVIRTVQVTASGGGSGGGGDSGGGDDAVGDEGAGEPGGEDRGSEAAFKSARKQAKAAIDAAFAGGGKGEKIAEAREKLNEADRKAAGGDYEEAIEKAREAERKADEALNDR